MVILPNTSLALLSRLPLTRSSIPKDLHHPLQDVLIELIVLLTSRYRELASDLDQPSKWTKFKAFEAERINALKIGERYRDLYTTSDQVTTLIPQLSFMKVLRWEVTRLARANNLGGIVSQPVESADPEQLHDFVEMVMQIVKEAIEEMEDEVDWDAARKEWERYWREEVPALPLRKRIRVERDAQIFFCLYLYVLHTAVSVMAYGETLSSLVQRALAATGSKESDDAMCKAVRVESALCDHPAFNDRYLVARRNGETDFLFHYNNTATPLTYTIRYPGLYLLMSLLDAFGLLDRITNEQLGHLCDRAKLDRWENRIEDATNLGKRRKEYQAKKFRKMSTHLIH
jgi:hypothetical protein